MESLFIFQQGLLASVSNEFRRFLHGKINWKLRMIGIKGAPWRWKNHPDAATP